MKSFFKFMFKLTALAGVAVGLVKALDAFRGSPDGVGDEGFALSGAGDQSEDQDPYAVDEATLGGEVSSELLERLVCPLDKGPLELVDGKWLVNERNGYRYPISDGIPVMLVEVGERYRDAALATANGDSTPA